ncbi:NSS family neurotransmitter:Na+ symporter [Rhodothalassium salexigens DSM 2132]|uniref:NSS family neurotransmitter:Na+ symporter n=1 Tax=Rhodothalassium salexigens DSM 2132 TaxID=1188247 RepID=A0A4R2PNN4_RHOSA|nr:sodium-dependent transporter [Rhodothalassium salexigens]MBB4210964.1 NSS family neurotransmitter:Na+ symporter [Rhodothalassium salexigens DSM 2132]TCP36378.1 NSS family neurotransmitter:Na+ symporter [Rhodothalassium salexigens DSM 2132]
MAGAAGSPEKTWSSRTAFILAAVGSAVGLGNVWKFPYEVGAGGGGAFVLIYLVFVFAIGLPVMIAELLVGRRGHAAPPIAAETVAAGSQRHKSWAWLGWIGVIGAFFVLSFYSVIAGFSLSYMVETVTGRLGDLTPEASVKHFTDDIGGSFAIVFGWHTLFMVLTVFIVARGIKGGLEQAVTYLMPALFVLLVGMVIYSLSVGEAGKALQFLFQPRLSDLTTDNILQALGQAFFSLSLALGAIMTYGAYVPRDYSLPRSAFIIAAADTAVAILAGLAIFPLVFQYGLEANAGPGLVFITLPLAFAEMPGGVIVGGAFFLLLSIAALTSAISLLEPTVSWLEEKRGIARAKAAVWGGLAIYLVGIGSVMSFNVWSDVTFWRGTVLDNIDFITNNVMMPLGGLGIAVFVAWFMNPEAVRSEVTGISDRLYKAWLNLLGFVCPVALAAIFFSVSGADRLVLRIVDLAGYGVSEDPGERLLHATIVFIVMIMPSLLAARRRHPQLALLAFVNVVAGWQPIGWLFCLVWAHRPDLLTATRRAVGARDDRVQASSDERSGSAG